MGSHRQRLWSVATAGVVGCCSVVGPLWSPASAMPHQSDPRPDRAGTAVVTAPGTPGTHAEGQDQQSPPALLPDPQLQPQQVRPPNTPQASAEARLIGRAVLPPDTFIPGPTSGHFINPRHGRAVPFADLQPVQGFSAVLATAEPGVFLALSDNGFGSKGNSADYLLRLHHIRPHFQTAATPLDEPGGDPKTGSIEVLSTIWLRDPDRVVGWPIIADREVYPPRMLNRFDPGEEPSIDPRVRADRHLTGSDFDIESVQVMPDGTLWIGEEFGPYLLHFDATGRLLAPPLSLPGVFGIDRPDLKLGQDNLARSRGVEGMAIAPAIAGDEPGDQAENSPPLRLYPMLEGSLKPEVEERVLRIFECDPIARTFTDRIWRYPLERDSAEPHAIGELTHIEDDLFLVIERDNEEGEAAAFKKIFLVRFGITDEEGRLVKRELVDLLAVPDPDRLGGAGTDDETGTYRFPYVTIESVLMIDERTIGVVNDNNYPFSSGRTEGEPDGTEFILITFPRPVSDYFPAKEVPANSGTAFHRPPGFVF